MAEPRKQIDRVMFREALEQEDLASRDQRVDRYLSVKSLPFTPYHPSFSAVSSECLLLFRDGRFFACISLCQSVAEGLSRMLCVRSHIRSHGPHKSRFARLAKESVISSSSEAAFTRIHERRDDFHHLNPATVPERRELERLAKRCLRSLASIEREVFAVSKAGRPKYPRFWSSPAV